jgi:hypothetical protein
MDPRRLLPVLLLAAGLFTIDARIVSAQGTAAAAPAAGALKDRFAGTWKLVSIEQRNAKGEVLPPTGTSKSTGYLIYDPAGYMAVSIMPIGRKKYADAQPTDDEAKATITGYAGYFGTFTINEKEQFVTHHLEGSVNPAMAKDQKRFFEMSPNRLTLKPPAAANGNQSRLTWERMPDLPDLTAEQRRFIGFWKLVSNERRDQKGSLVLDNPGQFGYIIYTPAGFMMVHMVQPNRQPAAGSQPTPKEAREQLRTYTNYFGPFYVHQDDGYVVHDQFGSLSRGRNSPAPMQRYYRFVGNRLLLQPPAIYNPGGETLQGTITWEKVGAARGSR